MKQNGTLNDFSLVTCSYNTPEILKLCLKSFVFHHGKGPHQIIVVENSTEPETKRFLNFNNIPFIENSGGTHSPSVDIAFEHVRTKYALLVDTDILFENNIADVFESFHQNEFTLMGEIQGDRGGFQLFPRVAPYFCLIDMDHIHVSNIRFHNADKVRASGSDGFFGNIPINNNGTIQRFYDVGSTFYEEVEENKYRIKNFEFIANYVFHAESLSWAFQTGIEKYVLMGQQRQNDYFSRAIKYVDIEIRDCFSGC